MNLRTARPDEADAIARLWQSGWHDGHAGHVPQALVGARTEESFRGRARSRLHEFTVAEVDGDVAGFIVVVEDELEQLYVSRIHRGQGVADTLLREAERVIRANGHSVGWLAVVEGNARARGFYERNGWHDEGAFDYAAAGDSGPIAVPCRR